MKPSSGLANLAIEGVLELSADAHIERKMTARNSSDFHRLTGAIAALKSHRHRSVPLRQVRLERLS